MRRRVTPWPRPASHGREIRLVVGRDAVAAAIARLFRTLDDENEAAVEALQGLVNRLLDEAPAASLALLERSCSAWRGRWRPMAPRRRRAC